MRGAGLDGSDEARLVGSLDLGVVERRRRRVRCRPARRRLAPAAATAAAGARAIVCCEPMIQPPRNPTSVPAAA